MTSNSEAYKLAGVDIDAGERAVELMKSSIAKSRRKEKMPCEWLHTCSVSKGCTPSAALKELGVAETSGAALDHCANAQLLRLHLARVDAPVLGLRPLHVKRRACFAGHLLVVERAEALRHARCRGEAPRHSSLRLEGFSGVSGTDAGVRQSNRFTQCERCKTYDFDYVARCGYQIPRRNSCQLAFLIGVPGAD